MMWALKQKLLTKRKRKRKTTNHKIDYQVLMQMNFLGFKIGKKIISKDK
jgi:hypothetical protein